MVKENPCYKFVPAKYFPIKALHAEFLVDQGIKFVWSMEDRVTVGFELSIQVPRSRGISYEHE